MIHSGFPMDFLMLMGLVMDSQTATLKGFQMGFLMLMEIYLDSQTAIRTETLRHLG